MPCYHPIVAYQHKTEKTKLGKSLILFGRQWDNNENVDRIELPCGGCIGCKLDKANEWAARCIYESEKWKHNHFITLTYSEENTRDLTKSCVDVTTGEVTDKLSLNKRDLQLFLKRLRSHYKREFNHTNIRFFACGEYGEHTERPHYHLILFNLPIIDLEPFFINKHHQQIYRSKTIEEIWGKGHVSVGELTFESAAYVARYTLKKLTKAEAECIGIEPEFINMSRKPGIGADYLKDNYKEIYENDELILRKSVDKVVKQKPIKYFDKLYEQIDPEALYDIKLNRRENAIEARKIKMSHTTLTESEVEALEERSLLRRITSLKREMTESC